MERSRKNDLPTNSATETIASSDVTSTDNGSNKRQKRARKPDFSAESTVSSDVARTDNSSNKRQKRARKPDFSTETTASSDATGTDDGSLNKRQMRNKKGESSKNVHEASSSGVVATVSSDVTETDDGSLNKRQKRNKKGESSNIVHEASSSGVAATVSSNVTERDDGSLNKRQKCDKKEESSNDAHEASCSGEDLPPILEDFSKDYKCSICLDTNSFEEMKQLKCAHIFHKMCINAWLDRRTSCPICREEIPSPLGHQSSSSDQMTLEQVLRRIQEVMLQRQGRDPSTIAERLEQRVQDVLPQTLVVLMPTTEQPQEGNERLQAIMRQRPGLRRIARAAEQLQVVRQEFHSHLQELRRRLGVYNLDEPRTLLERVLQCENFSSNTE